MSFFKTMTQSKDKVIREEYSQSKLNISRAGQNKSAEAPKLVDFTFEIKPLEAQYFYDRESRTFTHDVNKIAYSTTIPISAHQHAALLFKFDSTELPEMSETIDRKTQYISREFETSKPNDHEGNYRFKHNIIGNEYTVAGLPLTDYLKLQLHLPTVVEFLKIYETPPSHHDTELPEDTINMSNKMK